MRVKVVGVTFRNDDVGVDRQEVIATLCGKEKVYLKREPENRFDSNAVAVMLKREVEKDFKIGYIRSELAAFLSSMWSKYKFFANICEIKTGDLESKVPYGVMLEVSYSPRKKFKPSFNGSSKKIFID
jgi:hypothetical protein